MTPEQGAKLDALARCTFVPGTGAKAFVYDLVRKFARTPDAEPTQKQMDYLSFLCYRFRGQLAAWVPAAMLGQWVEEGKQTPYYRKEC